MWTFSFQICFWKQFLTREVLKLKMRDWQTFSFTIYQSPNCFQKQEKVNISLLNLIFGVF